MQNPNDAPVPCTGEAVLHTRSGAHALQIRVAATFLTRFAGLMLTRPLPPAHGFLLTRCPSVHTAFMRYAIDVVYLDEGGRVLKCVAGLKPWRGSFSHTGRDGQGRRHRRAAHTLELAAGNIARMDIRAGDRLQHPLWSKAAEAQKTTPSRAATRQRGAAMLEFVVVGPILTLLGLALLQYGLLFFAKNQINHASFMAARAGSMGNASLATVRQAYEKALIPLYGGGSNAGELADALSRARTDLGGHLRIELLNPTKESFDDWNDPALQRTIGKGKGGNGGDARVIPNVGLAFKNPDEIQSNSGQSIHDANLIKLRITHGVAPKVPLMGLVYRRMLKWLDPGDDRFHTQLVEAGRIPVVTHVTLHMQSDAIEPVSPVSTPGMGNNGSPINPGDPPVTTEPPPNCATIGCTVELPATPADPGGGGDDGGSGCTGSSCPACPSANKP